MNYLSEKTTDAVIALLRVVAKLLGIKDYEASVRRYQQLSEKEQEQEMLATVDRLREKIRPCLHERRRPYYGQFQDPDSPPLSRCMECGAVLRQPSNL